MQLGAAEPTALPLLAKHLMQGSFLRLKAPDLTSSVFLFQSFAVFPSLSDCFPPVLVSSLTLPAPLSPLNRSPPRSLFFYRSIFLLFLVPDASIIYVFTWTSLKRELSTRAIRVIRLHLSIHLAHTYIPTCRCMQMRTHKNSYNTSGRSCTHSPDYRGRYAGTEGTFFTTWLQVKNTRYIEEKLFFSTCLVCHLELCWFCTLLELNFVQTMMSNMWPWRHNALELSVAAQSRILSARIVRNLKTLW